MSPFARVSCPTCREDRDVLLANVSILHYPDHTEWLAYRCPICNSNHQTPLPSVFAARVRSFGTPIIDLPELDNTDAPVLTEDDLIAFGLELEAAEEITV